MGYKDWLFDQLSEEGVLDGTSMESVEDITLLNLETETDLDDYELGVYKDQYCSWCQMQGMDPIFDLD